MTVAEREDPVLVGRPDGQVVDADLVDDADQIPDDDDPSTELERHPDAWAPSPARATMARYVSRPLPTIRQLWRSTRWWGGTLKTATPRAIVHALPTLLAQIRPTLRGIGRGLQMWAVWRCGSDWLHDVKQAEGNDRAKRRSEWERKRHARNVISGIVIVILVVALLVGSAVWPWHTLVALGVVLVGFDAWGHRRAGPVETGGALPMSPLREGAPLRVVIPQVLDILAGRGHDATIVNPSAGEFGLEMDLHAATPLDDQDMETLERGLQAFPGAVSRIQDPTNAAVGKLRIMWKDPLAVINPMPLWEPLSQSVNAPANLGYGLAGAPLYLNFLRTNVIIIGGPGSGKSSCLWCMIDYLTACRDVVLDGIDLSGATALDAWGGCIRHFASTEAEATEVLKDALDLADRRTRAIAGRSRPVRGGPPVGPENFGTADGPAHIILVDELPLLAKFPKLLELYVEHQRVGRKAASTSVATAQDILGPTLGSTSLRRYPSTTILLACSREDVTTALGGGKVKEGWAPHRFVPAEGDDFNDAGKCFIHSGRHRVPNPWRFNRHSDISEIHLRALARMDAGMPTLDDNDDVIDGSVIPERLEPIWAAFAAAGWPEFMATEDVLAAIATSRGMVLSADKLAKLVAPGLAPDRTRRRSNGARHPRKGYLADAVRDAVRQAEADEGKAA